jgi:hypothetical protein
VNIYNPSFLNAALAVKNGGVELIGIDVVRASVDCVFIEQFRQTIVIEIEEGFVDLIDIALLVYLRIFVEIWYLDSSNTVSITQSSVKGDRLQTY